MAYTSWLPHYISITSLLFGVSFLSIGIYEVTIKSSVAFGITFFWFGTISAFSSILAQINYLNDEHDSLSGPISLITLENFFIFILSTLSLLDVIDNYRIYTKHNAYHIFHLLEKYKWIGIIVFSITALLSLSCLLFIWTFYEKNPDELDTLLGNSTNLSNDFWQVPTTRTTSSKIFTPRIPYNPPLCNKCKPNPLFNTSF